MNANSRENRHPFTGLHPWWMIDRVRLLEEDLRALCYATCEKRGVDRSRRQKTKSGRRPCLDRSNEER